MKFNIKQKILELLDTLQEANKYIYNHIDMDYSYISEICIDAIETLKSNFSECKNLDNEILDRCKELKNNFFLLHKSISSENIEVCSIIENQLKCIEEMVYRQTDEKIDIVFLPYNASMWNSLESIWKAAVEDPVCNCYVIPIPYYKIDSSREGGEIFCYEGEKLPNHVPIVDYREIDLSDLKPDVIYVHNQYDDCNSATRVESEYFSYNLKRHTNMLVYVTYAILGVYPVSFYDSFYSFIRTREFDKVIVQSDIFKKIAEKSGINPNKILSLGSPKMDNLIQNLKQQKVDSKLKDRFKNKKVFLWTTNLMKIINSRDKALDEIEELFKTIKNRPECGLIFRPHPLERVYIQSKAPECVKRYEQILRDIAKVDNIVLDETADYYEAFSVSDALISDRSSVLIEYMATGKPVLVYDIEINEKYYDKEVFDIFANYIVGQITVNDFIEMVLKEEDREKEKRLNALKNVIVNSDGSSGNKIHNQIKLAIGCST